MKTKKTLLIALFSFLFINIHAQTTISANGQKYIDNFMKLRMELTANKEKKDAVKALNSYKASNPYANYTNQEKLIIDSFYILEKYNYTWEEKGTEAALKKELISQADKNEAFIKNNKNNTSGWVYVLTADLYSCYMSYSPMSGAMKYGMTVKNYYQECLKIDPKNSYCLTHMGQWYYWAPGINGGSNKKALQSFKDAVTYARNDADRFYANMFLSQMYFELKDKASAKTYLSKAETIYPASETVKELKKYNAQGYSLFTYSKKKAEDEKRVD